MSLSVTLEPSMAWDQVARGRHTGPNGGTFNNEKFNNAKFNNVKCNNVKFK